MSLSIGFSLLEKCGVRWPNRSKMTPIFNWHFHFQIPCSVPPIYSYMFDRCDFRFRDRSSQNVVAGHTVMFNNITSETRISLCTLPVDMRNRECRKIIAPPEQLPKICQLMRVLEQLRIRGRITL